MNSIVLIRAGLGAFLMLAALAAAQPAAAPASPASPAPEKSDVPGAPKGRGPKGPRPDFWAGKLNNAATFNNRGIDGFRHGSLVSKKMNFKRGGDTEVGYTVYLPPDYAASGRQGDFAVSHRGVCAMSYICPIRFHP